MNLIMNTRAGLYCPQGDFYIDPHYKVEKALITHGHSDHARFGSEKYLCHHHSKTILQHRLGENIDVTGIAYNEKLLINGVSVSFHPAGHVLGSAQIRLEYKGEIWVISGDYKLASDPTCEKFANIKCHHFITESTFALPLFKWESNHLIFDKINRWWENNAGNQKPSLIGAYSLGKAQRILASINPEIGPIYLHGAIHNLMPCYESAHINFPNYSVVDLRKKGIDYSSALILAPPSAIESSWANRFHNKSTALASGWMNIRGNKRRRNIETGFVLSDHADWPSLISAIKNSEAEEIIVTHGYSEVLARFLNEIGLNARTFADEELL